MEAILFVFFSFPLFSFKRMRSLSTEIGCCSISIPREVITSEVRSADLACQKHVPDLTSSYTKRLHSRT